MIPTMVVKTMLKLIETPVKPVISLPIPKYPNNEITIYFASNASIVIQTRPWLDLTYCLGDVETRIGSSTIDLLQPSLSSACREASLTVVPMASQSSLIISIHLFFGRPLPLCPCTYPFIAIKGYLPFSILLMCPKYRSLLSCIIIVNN